MKTKRMLFFLLALTLVIPLALGVNGVKAATPSFIVKEVVTDKSVTIQMSDMPANRDFVAQMGEYDKQGVGIKIAEFFTGGGGALLATFNIPDALKGRAMISIRIDSTNGAYSAYNTFWNNSTTGTWPGGTPPATTPAATTPATTSTTAATVVPVNEFYSGIPTFYIKSVDIGKTVTIVTNNFPKNYDFVVRMGKMWTLGIGGIEVKTINSKEGGIFEATFEIPAALKNDQRVSIRLDSKTGGFYAFNWFWNIGSGVVTAPVPATSTTPVAQQNIPTFSITAVVKDKTVSIKGINFPANTTFRVLMGKMWTLGIGGVEAGSFNSGEGGTFTATYPIPASLVGETQISIRLQSGYYFAYNWFWNSSTSN